MRAAGCLWEASLEDVTNFTRKGIEIIGTFSTELEAAVAHDVAALEEAASSSLEQSAPSNADGSSDPALSSLLIDKNSLNFPPNGPRCLDASLAAMLASGEVLSLTTAAVASTDSAEPHPDADLLRRFGPPEKPKAMDDDDDDDDDDSDDDDDEEMTDQSTSAATTAATAAAATAAVPTTTTTGAA